MVGATIAQIALTTRSSLLKDPTYDLWPAVVSTQIVQALSITTACLMYLRPFLESLESGLIRSDDLRRTGMVGSYGYGSSHNTKERSKNISTGSGNRAGILSSIALQPLQLGENTTQTQTTERPWEDGQSDSSQTRIIKRTRSWTVATEPRLPNAVTEIF